MAAAARSRMFSRRVTGSSSSTCFCRSDTWAPRRSPFPGRNGAKTRPPATPPPGAALLTGIRYQRSGISCYLISGMTTARRTALRSEPKQDLAGLLQTAHAAHATGAFAEAERLYKGVLAHAPDDAAALHLLGFLYYQRGRLRDALPLLSAAVQRNCGEADALWNLGLVLHGLGRPEEALARYAGALALDPHNPDLLNVHAAALLDLGRPQEALAQTDRALAIKPDHIEALGNRGNALVKLNRPDEA